MNSQSAEYPLATVVVVCLNEFGKIGHCLQSLLELDYEKGGYEILVVDNDSTDGTKEFLMDFEKRVALPRFRYIVNPAKGIAGSRNIGLREASHDLVAFTDADCVVPKGWLSCLVASFMEIRKRDEHLIAVGGANFPPKDTSAFYDALSITLKTYMGNRGSTQGRVFDKITKVPHMPTVNILYDRNKVLAAGGFDETFATVCEDPELHHRLGQKGYSIYFVPGGHVWHHMRDTLVSYGKNIFNYGLGRVRIIRKHPEHYSNVYLLPPLVFLALVFGNIIGMAHPYFLLVNLYFIILLAYSFVVALVNNRPELTFAIFLIYTTTHLAYAAGELKELLLGKQQG